MKCLTVRKVDKEGNIAELTAHGLLRLVLVIQFRCRGELVTTGVHRLLSLLF